jgi:tetratricopeptide (TPR) repeat protein
MKKTIILTLICLSLAAAGGRAQNAESLKARNLELARRLMDRSLYDQSVALLEAADRWDESRTAVWKYEMGLARYLEKNYREAIKLLRRATRFRDASEGVFDLLADCYVLTGRKERALDVCGRGLWRFPGSGMLYHRLGQIYEGFEDPDLSRLQWRTGMIFDRADPRTLALESYTEGLVADPLRADNWFDAARLQLDSDDKAFGMVNGETAICLDPDSGNAGSMAEKLLGTYENNISFQADTTLVTGFSNPVVAAEVQEDGKHRFPFPVYYEAVLALVAGSWDDSGVESLIAIRRQFIELWWAEGFNTAYPCALFDYHHALIEAGHWEAYNHWLFSSMQPDRAALDALMEWFHQNPIIKP